MHPVRTSRCRGAQVELVVWLAQMVPAMPSILGEGFAVVGDCSSERLQRPGGLLLVIAARNQSASGKELDHEDPPQHSQQILDPMSDSVRAQGSDRGWNGRDGKC